MANTCLVIADADKIHDYVFSPRKLKLIRGGSAIQARLNKERLLLVLKDFGTGNLSDTKIQDGPAVEPYVEGGADWEVVFAGGGTVMCHFRDRGKAGEYCERVERLFYEHTGTATITPSMTDWRNSFKETLELAQRQLELEKSGRRRRLFSGHTPYWKTCEGCGGGSAGAHPEGRCGACQKRFESAAASPYFKKINQRLKCRLHEPEDFEAVAAGGYLAMVYVDGDSMGKYLAIHGSDSKQKYRELSAKVQGAVEGGVVNACEGIGRKLSEGATAPFEVLLIGGDDAIVVLGAEYAIDFLADFDDHWELKDARYSAAIVWAHDHFPIGHFLEQAEGLLRSAKRRKDVNSADYRVISEAMARAEVKRAADLTTAKPYSVTELRELRDGVRRWKAGEVPVNKVNELYRIAFQPEHQGKVEYDFLLARLKKSQRAAVEDVVGKELRDPGTGKTKAADVAELWNFVGGADAGRQENVAAAGKV